MSLIVSIATDASGSIDFISEIQIHVGPLHSFAFAKEQIINLE